MKDNLNITTVSINTNLEYNFKNPELNKAATKISELYTSARATVSEKSHDIAVILANVADKELYKADFKTVTEFGENVFGMKQSFISQYVHAGRIYNDAKMPKTVKTMSPAQLYELRGVEHSRIIKDANDGNLPETTEKLREYGNANREKKNIRKKAEILTNYDVIAVCGRTVTKQKGTFVDKQFDELAQSVLNGNGGKVHTITDTVKLSTVEAEIDGKKVTYKRKLYLAFDAAVILMYAPHVEKVAKTVKPQAVIYTVEELTEMLKAAKALEKNATKLDGKK